jgi:hypothetical protein
MTVFNAGLPQFSSSASDPIGTTRLFPGGFGTTITLGDQVWLAAGFAATASQYPAASQVPSLKIAPLIAHAGNANTVYQVATDGAGTFVATTNSTNVYVSTNGGATWSTASANLGGLNATGVAYGGGRFVAVGNGVGSIYASFSTNGTSWTAGGVGGIVASGTYTADSSRIVYGGTQFVGVAGGASGGTNSGFTSANGTSASTFNLAAAVTDPQIAWNGSGYLIGGTNAVYRSTNGSTWSSSSPSVFPATTSYGKRPIVAGVNGVFVFGGQDANDYLSVDNGATWSRATGYAPGVSASNSQLGLWSGNDEIVLLSYSSSGSGLGRTIYVSRDLRNWRTYAFDTAYYSASLTGAFYDGTRFATLQSGGVVGHYCSNINQASLVGVVTATVVGSSYSYVRIK